MSHIIDLDLALALGSPCGLPDDFSINFKDVTRIPTSQETVIPCEWTLDDLLPQDRMWETGVQGVSPVDGGASYTVLDAALCGYSDTLIRTVWRNA